MDEAKEIELKKLLDISRKMLASAESNNWEKLADLETERKMIMSSFFEEQISERHSARVGQAIKNVLAMNKKIEQLALQEKVTIGQQLQGLKKKQNVHSAYLQNK